MGGMGASGMRTEAPALPGGKEWSDRIAGGLEAPGPRVKEAAIRQPARARWGSLEAANPAERSAGSWTIPFRPRCLPTPPKRLDR